MNMLREKMHARVRPSEQGQDRSYRLRYGRTRRGHLVVGAILLATVLYLSFAVSGSAMARHPGSCYCYESEPPYPSWDIKMVTSQTIHASGGGSNSYVTSPWFNTEDPPYNFYTGEMGLDQGSTASGEGSYEWVTSIGLQDGDYGFPGSLMESGFNVAFYWNWYINWAWVTQDNTVSECTASLEYGGQVTLAANVHDVTTNTELLSTAQTAAVDSESNNIYDTGNAGPYSVSFTTGPLNPNDYYEMQGWVVVETNSYIQTICGGAFTAYYNLGDGGAYAQLQDFGAYST
jgi:hypothetical protein